MNCISFLMIGFVFITELNSQEINFKVIKTSTDWEGALARAGRENKFIFLDIYATWCGPCKMMDAKVYNDSSVAAYFNGNFINAKIDGETEFGMILARQYRLTAYPTMFFINSKKEAVFTVVGFRDSPKLSGIGKQVVDHGERIMILGSKFDTSQIKPEEEKEYLNLLLLFGQIERFEKVAAGTLDKLSKENIFDPANQEIILKGGGDIESNVVSIVLKNAIHFKNTWGIEEFNGYLSRVFNTSMQNAVMQKDEMKMEKIVNEFVPLYLADSPEQISGAKLTTRKIYYSQIKDWDNYLKSIEDFYAGLLSPAKNFFYNEVYYIVENSFFNDQVLGKALEWINREIASDPDFEGYFLGTLVNVYRKDFKQAEIWMARAEPLAVTEEDKNSVKELKTYLEKLKNGISESP